MEIDQKTVLPNGLTLGYYPEYAWDFILSLNAEQLRQYRVVSKQTAKYGNMFPQYFLC